MMGKRMEKLKRYITGCTALLLIPAMMIFTACGNDAQVNSVKTAENIEAMENVESENAFTEESQPSCGVNEQSGQAKTEPERQNKIALQGRVLLEKPIVNWNGKREN